MRNRYVLSFLLMFIFLTTGMIFYGCGGEKYENLSIELSNTDLEFDLDSEEAFSQTLTATINGWKGEMLPGLIPEIADVNVASVTMGEPDGNATQLTITALGAGETTLSLRAKEFSKVKIDNIKIVVKKSPDSITPQNKRYALKQGEELALNIQDLLITSPNRIYPAEAMFSILPTPAQVNSNNSLTSSRKAELIGLWNADYGETNPTNVRIENNVLKANANASEGIVQILARVGNCECSFGVLIYSSDINLYSITSNDGTKAATKLKLENELGLLENGNKDYSIKLTSSERENTIVVGIPENDNYVISLKEVSDYGEILRIDASGSLFDVVGEVKYRTYVISGLSSGETAISLSVDMKYGETVFVTKECLYSVIISQDIDGIVLTSRSGTIVNTDIYPILTNYQTSAVGAEFTISLVPGTNGVVVPMFFVNEISKIETNENETPADDDDGETDSVPQVNKTDIKDKVHIYTNEQNIIDKINPRNVIVEYELNAREPIYLKEGSKIYVTADDVAVGTNIEISIKAVMKSPLGFTSGKEKTIPCRVVDSVKSVKLLSEYKTLQLSAESESELNSKNIVFIADTRDKDAQFEYQYDSSKLIVSEEGREIINNASDPNNGKLKVTVLVTSNRFEGRTNLVISALSGQIIGGSQSNVSLIENSDLSDRVECFCYLEVTEDDFVLAVMEQYQSMLKSYTSGWNKSLDVSMYIEKNANRRVGIAYKVGNTHSYNDFTYRASVFVDGEYLPNELNTKFLASNHYFLFTPDTGYAVRENTTCEIRVVFDYYALNEQTIWESKTCERKVKINVLAPLMEMKWSDGDNLSLADNNSQNILLYPEDELSLDSKNLSTKTLTFAADVSLKVKDIVAFLDGIELADEPKIDGEGNVIAPDEDDNDIVDPNEPGSPITQTIEVSEFTKDGDFYSIHIVPLTRKVSHDPDDDTVEEVVVGRYKYWVITITLKEIPKDESNNPKYAPLNFGLAYKNDENPRLICIVMPTEVMLTDRVEVTNCSAIENGVGLVSLKISDNENLSPESFIPNVNVFAENGKVPTYSGFDYFVEQPENDEDKIVIYDEKTNKFTANKAGEVEIYVYPRDRLVSETTMVDLSKFSGADAWPYFKLTIIVCDGSETYPYQIYTASDFVEMKTWGLNKHYVIKNNLDMSNVNFAGFGSFSGSLTTEDENIYAINGLSNYVYVDSENNTTYVGLFKEIINGKIANITFNFYDLKNINDDSITTLYYGALAGKIAFNQESDDDNKLKNVSVELTNANKVVEISCANSTGLFVGGIAGDVTNSLTNKLVFSNVKTEANFKVNCSDSAKLNLGGMFGVVSENIEILSTLSAVNVVNLEANCSEHNTQSAIGGLVGNLSGSLVNAKVIGEIKASKFDNVGGVVGENAGVLGFSNGSGETASIQPIESGVLVSGHSNIGGLVGLNSGNVKNCYVVTYVYNSVDTYILASGVANVGGLIGQSSGGSVSYSYVMSFVNGDIEFEKKTTGSVGYLGDVLGSVNVGGLVGSSVDTIYSSCFANVNIQLLSESSKVGGLFGVFSQTPDNSSSISNFYANCKIIADTENAKIGQFAGEYVSGSLSTGYTYVFMPNGNEKIYLNLNGTQSESYSMPTTIYYLGSESSGQIKTEADLKSLNLNNTTVWKASSQVSGDYQLNDGLPVLLNVNGSVLITYPVTKIELTLQDPDETNGAVTIYSKDNNNLGFVVDLAKLNVNELTHELNNEFLAYTKENETAAMCKIQVFEEFSDTNIEITSSNENVVSVDNTTKKVKFIGVGHAIITLTSSTNRYVSNSYEVNIINSAMFKVIVNSEEIELALDANEAYVLDEENYTCETFVTKDESHTINAVFDVNNTAVIYANAGFSYNNTESGNAPYYVAVGAENVSVVVKPYWVLYFGGERIDSYTTNQAGVKLTLKPYAPTVYNVSVTELNPESGETTQIIVDVDDDNATLELMVEHGSNVATCEITEATHTLKFGEVDLLNVNVQLNGNKKIFVVSLVDGVRNTDKVLAFNFNFKFTNNTDATKVDNENVEIQFGPARVNRLNLNFYTEGIEDYLKGKEMPSTSISAAKQGMLVIDVVQEFADFDYAIVSPIQNKEYVSLQQIVLENKTVGGETQHIIHNLENNNADYVRVEKYSEWNGNEYNTFSGIMFVRVLLNNNLHEGQSVSLNVKLIKESNSEDRIVCEKEIVLYVDFVSWATVELSSSYKTDYYLDNNVVGKGTVVELLLNGEFRNCEFTHFYIENGNQTVLGESSEVDDGTKCYYQLDSSINWEALGKTDIQKINNAVIKLFIGPNVNATSLDVKVGFVQSGVVDKLPYDFVAKANTPEGLLASNEDAKLVLDVVDFCVTGFEVVNLDSGTQKSLVNNVLPISVGVAKPLLVKIDYFDLADYAAYSSFVLNPMDESTYLNMLTNGVLNKVELATNTINEVRNATRSGVKWRVKDYNNSTANAPVYVDLSMRGDYIDFLVRENEFYELEGKNNVEGLDFKVEFNFGYKNGQIVIQSGELSGALANKLNRQSSEFKVDIIGGNLVNDMPTPISTAEEFRAMGSGNYILANDIDLGINWSPLSLANSKLTLDGNGYILSLGSISTTESNVGLFSTVGSDVLLKNLIVSVNYNNVDLQEQNSVNFGFIAGENNGIIYNCDVVVTAVAELGSNYGFESQNNDFTYVTSVLNRINSNSPGENQYTKNLASFFVLTQNGVTANIGGFVGVNNGYITNCRVGRISSETLGYSDKVSLQGLNIFGAGNVGGFVGTNNNAISNSYFANGLVVNYSSNSRSATGGFVAVQNANARINSCYVQGGWDNDSQPRSDIEGIFSQQSAGGFVHTCSGNITNSYASMKIFEGASMGGFVYSMQSSAVLENCYSSSLIDENSINSGSFIGVDTRNNLQYYGNAKLTNCFYYSALDDDTYGIQSKYAKPIFSGNWVDVFGSSFVGFAFSQNGIDGTWHYDSEKPNFGPQLTFANKVFYSHRNIENFNRYDKDCEPGSEINPILITNFSEGNSFYSWNYVFDNNTIYDESEKIYKLTSGVHISILRDLEFNAQTNSFNTQFSGALYGNGYRLTNFGYNINQSSKSENFGLFDSIAGGEIHDFTINVASFGLNSTTAKNIGVLAGTITSLANPSFIENIVIYGPSSLSGSYVLGGLAGFVDGDCYIQNVNVSNLTITSSSGSGIVGSVIGKLDLNVAESSILPRIYSLTASGSINLKASKIGGILGYVGEYSDVDNISFIVPTSSSSRLTAASNGAVIGGLIGELQGKLSRGYIGDDVLSQQQRDETRQVSNVIGNSNLFVLDEKANLSVGGIAGKCIGDIEYSYVRINLPNIAGAFIGLSTSASLNEVYIVGNYYDNSSISYSVAGGTNTTLNKVVLLSGDDLTNYLSNSINLFSNYTKDKWNTSSVFPTLEHNYAYVKTNVGNFADLVDALRNSNSDTIIKITNDITIDESTWINNGTNILDYINATKAEGASDKAYLTGIIDGSLGPDARAKITLSGLTSDNFTSFFGKIDGLTLSNVDFEFDNSSFNGEFSLLATESSNSKFSNMNITLGLINSTTSGDFGGLVTKASNSDFGNITLSGRISVTTSNSGAVGGVVGFIQGTKSMFNNIDLSNLELEVSSTATGEYYIGALAGRSIESTQISITNVKLANLVKLNTQNSLNNVYLGGIVGFSGAQSYISNVSSNVNNPRVEIIGSAISITNLNLGGIAGQVNGKLDKSEINATILVNLPNASITTLNAGGLLGWMQARYKSEYTNISSSSFLGSINIGTETGIGVDGVGSMCLGGAIGRFELTGVSASTMISNAIVDICTECNITFKATTVNEANIGGVIGFVRGMNGVNTYSGTCCIVDKSVVYNTLNINVTQITTQANIGGVIGQSFAKITNSISNGTIQTSLGGDGDKFVGGIAGMQNVLHSNNSTSVTFSSSGSIVVRIMYGKDEVDELKNVTNILISPKDESTQQSIGEENKLSSDTVMELGLDYYLDLLEFNTETNAYKVKDNISVFLGENQLRIVVDGTILVKNVENSDDLIQMLKSRILNGNDNEVTITANLSYN